MTFFVAGNPATPATLAEMRADLGLTATDVGFIQAGVGAFARNAQDKLRDYAVSVFDFMDRTLQVKVSLRTTTSADAPAITAAIQAAVNAVGLAGGGRVLFPRGLYFTNGVVTVDKNFVTLCGEGMAATVVRPVTAGQVGFLFQKVGGEPIEYCGIEGMDIFPTATIADCIRVVDHFWFTARSIRMPSGYTTGINLYKGATSYLTFLYDIFTNGGAVGVRVGEFGVGDIQNVFLYNCHLNAASVAGLRVKNVGGLQWIGGEALGCGRGAVFEASGTDRVKGVFCTSIYFDNANSETVRIAVTDTTARLSGVAFSSCSLNFSQAGDGVIVAGVSGDPGQLERVRFDGCDFLLNQLNGAYLTNCRDIDFVACHVSGNSDGASGVSSGIFVDAGVEGLRIQGGSSGSEDEFSATQAYGIVLAPGVSQIRISNVDLSGNVTGAVNNAGATDLRVSDCVGFVTANSGVATIPNGSANVTVNHGLGVSPGNGDIQITSVGDIGAAGRSRIWADNIGATTFRINTEGNVSANALVAWSARVLGA